MLDAEVEKVRMRDEYMSANIPSTAFVPNTSRGQLCNTKRPMASLAFVKYELMSGLEADGLQGGTCAGTTVPVPS